MGFELGFWDYLTFIDGVNTSVATIQAELALARFYLDNTIMVAPEDGYIMNLQVRPGMVAGDVRFGAIASLICDDDRYLVAQYFQENLKSHPAVSRFGRQLRRDASGWRDPRMSVSYSSRD
jgi:hypothetical protein